MTSEVKTSNFKRISERRVNKVLTALRVLANCSNRAAYEYTEHDVETIFGVIDEQTRAARAKFKQPAAAPFKW